MKRILVILLILIVAMSACVKKTQLTFDEIEALIEADDIDGAIDASEYLIRKDKENYKAWVMLINLYRYDSDLDKEIDALEDMIKVIKKNYQKDNEDIKYALENYDYTIGIIMANHDPDLDMPSSNEILQEIYEDMGETYDLSPYKNRDLTNYTFTLFQGNALSFDASKTGIDLIDSVSFNLTKDHMFNVTIGAFSKEYEGDLNHESYYIEKSYYYVDGNLKYYQYIEQGMQNPSAYSVYNPYYGMTISWNDGGNSTWIGYDEDYEAEIFDYPRANLDYGDNLIDAVMDSYNGMESIYLTVDNGDGLSHIWISTEFGIVLREEAYTSDDVLYYEYTTTRAEHIDTPDMSKFEIPSHLDLSN